MEQVRDKNARIRTIMANERTLLSYYRSAFAVIGLAAFVFKFYIHWSTTILSIIFLAFGLLISIYGTIRFRQKKKIIEATEFEL